MQTQTQAQMRVSMQAPSPTLGSVGELSVFYLFFAHFFFNRICSYHNDAEKAICRMCDSLPMDSDRSHHSFSVALPKRENPFATEELVPLPQPTSAIRPESSYDKHLEAYLPPKSHARPPSSAKVGLFLLVFILFYFCWFLLFRRLLYATKQSIMHVIHSFLRAHGVGPHRPLHSHCPLLRLRQCLPS